MEIKQITGSDYPRIYAFWAKHEIPFNFASSYEEFDAFLDYSHNLSYLCIENNEVIGTLLASYDGLNIHIYHILVDETKRRLGYGTKLILKLMEKANDYHYAKIMVETYNSNQIFAKFMKQINFNKRDDLCIYQK